MLLNVNNVTFAFLTINHIIIINKPLFKLNEIFHTVKRNIIHECSVSITWIILSQDYYGYITSFILICFFIICSHQKSLSQCKICIILQSMKSILILLDFIKRKAFQLHFLVFLLATQNFPIKTFQIVIAYFLCFQQYRQVDNLSYQLLL